MQATSSLDINSEPTFMGRSRPLVEVCRQMPRSAEPSSRGYASAGSQAVRNATCFSGTLCRDDRNLFQSPDTHCEPPLSPFLSRCITPHDPTVPL